MIVEIFALSDPVGLPALLPCCCVRRTLGSNARRTQQQGRSAGRPTGSDSANISTIMESEGCLAAFYSKYCLCDGANLRFTRCSVPGGVGEFVAFVTDEDTPQAVIHSRTDQHTLPKVLKVRPTERLLPPKNGIKLAPT